ncbi:aminoglycoside phosphotransferase [Paenibacillus contaminans]|uniref:Aminoglycoside phosphotransferase n=2 Tax=Paenibacillus contaminans TaxID=450362 RepID=A0A329M3Z9_9BACL|nr:aminoglycoside phosphotransferase [Paenibacillus contaminans]
MEGEQMKLAEEKGNVPDIDRTFLASVLKRLVGDSGATADNWSIRSIGKGTRNFVTEGIYRVEGFASADAGIIPWSIIVKIVRPDDERQDPAHYNYWRREALAYRSGLLARLPAGLRAPICYAVEEREDGSIRLWLEDIRGNQDEAWDDGQFAYAAGELGRLQGHFLQKESLADETWLNRAWLRSWVSQCRRFQPWTPGKTAAGFYTDNRIEHLAERFNLANGLFDEWVSALERLPRTLAHQDFYQDNLLILHDAAGRKELVAIDWQFASVSGVGEDLGRFYGLTVSRGNIPFERLEELRLLLLEAYIEGMRASGWSGDERMIRLGFLASFAIRSVWEVPKLLSKIAETEEKPERESAETEKLIQVAAMQMELVEDVEGLRRSLDETSAG